MTKSELDSSTAGLGLWPHFLLLVGLRRAPPCGLAKYLMDIVTAWRSAGSCIYDMAADFPREKWKLSDFIRARPRTGIT